MGGLPSVEMSNVLSEQKRQQVIALGRLGWTLRRIQRETAAACLKAAGIAVRPPGRWGRQPPAKPANEVTPEAWLVAGLIITGNTSRGTRGLRSRPGAGDSASRSA